MVITQFFKEHNISLANIYFFLEKHGGYIVKTTKGNYLTDNIYDDPKKSFIRLIDPINLDNCKFVETVEIYRPYLVSVEKYLARR